MAHQHLSPSGPLTCLKGFHFCTDNVFNKLILQFSPPHFQGSWILCHTHPRSYPRPGVPNPNTGPWPVGNPVAQQELSGRWATKLHLHLQPLLLAPINAWAPPAVRSAAALDSRRSSNPTVNCACDGLMSPTPYESIMPDALSCSWDGDGRTGERLQIQMITNRKVWLHKDHSKWIHCRRISKPY